MFLNKYFIKSLFQLQCTFDIILYHFQAYSVVVISGTHSAPHSYYSVPD